MKRTRIQDASFTTIERFAKENADIQFTDGSICKQIMNEYDKRIKEENYETVASEVETDKADNFVNIIRYITNAKIR